MRLAYSFAYRFIWDSVWGIYIFLPETACHNSDSLMFKLISSAITAELLVLSYCTQIQFRYSEVRLLKKTSNHKNEPTESTDEISANELRNKIYQTAYSTRSRICESTPGRISFEHFHWCYCTYIILIQIRLYHSTRCLLLCILGNVDLVFAENNLYL